MPGGPFTATEELRDLCAQREVLEEQLIQQLVARDAAQCAATEAAIAKIHARCEEIKSILGYDSAVQASQIAVPDLWRVVYHSERVNPAPDQSLWGTTVITDPGAGDVIVAPPSEGPRVSLGLDILSEDVGRWSVANAEARVTSGIIATGSAFFGVLEGPKAKVDALMRSIARDEKRHRDVVVIHDAKIDSRAFLRGCQLTCVPDGLLAHVMDRIRAAATSASRFAPVEVVDLARRGGHPLGFAVAGPKPMLVWTCMLDVRCGAVHRAPRYQEAAAAADKAVRAAGGVVVEKFGEFMSAVFPMVGGSTAAATVSAAVHAAVPFAVQSVVLEPIVLANQPDVVAFGPGFKKGKALLMLAERNRRPVIITAEAGEHCNRARQPLESFTIDCVNYYTLAGLGMERLENPPEPELIGPYNPGPEPPEPAEHASGSVKGSAAARRHDSQAFVRGALTNESLEELFRRIDVGGVGWIGKDAFRRAVRSDPDFPKAVDELAEKALEGWLARCNKAGDSRINFHEFAMVCLKLVHAT